MDWVITHRQTATAGRLVATSAFKVWLSRGLSVAAPLRHVAGGEPVARLNARLKDASES